jgi:glycosyltransferase involved in cell wall biosynthesis
MRRFRAVHQILPNFSYGDAIGDDTLQLRGLLRALGYESEIFAGVIHPYLVGEAHHFRRYREASHPENLLIYHFSVGSEISELVCELPDTLVIIFHNITPFHWFAGVNPHLWELSVEGERELARLADRAAAAWGDSEFNRRWLERLGYAHTDVLPILVDLERFSARPSPVVLRMYPEPVTTFLFVGRVSPNKCHQDLIRAFTFYQRHIDARARMFLVGEHRACRIYYEQLLGLAQRLRTRNLIFTGLVDFDELLAYYRLADVFLSMSEHEGFCVPLLEAMRLDLPVVAYAATAVPETLGGAGVLLHTKDPETVAHLLHEIVRHGDLRRRLIAGQRRRLARYENADYRSRLARLIDEIPRP